MENFMCSKPAEFYLRGINKPSDEWQVVIQKMVNRLLIEINSLFNYSWLNYLLLKRKLFMTQANIFIYLYIYMGVYVCVLKKLFEK